MFAGTATSIIFGSRQIQIVHELNILIHGLHLQAWIACFLFSDRRDRIALVVVSRINQRTLRQLQQPAEDRFILSARVAALKVGSALCRGSAACRR